MIGRFVCTSSGSGSEIRISQDGYSFEGEDYTLHVYKNHIKETALSHCFILKIQI